MFASKGQSIILTHENSHIFFDIPFKSWIIFFKFNGYYEKKMLKAKNV